MNKEQAEELLMGAVVVLLAYAAYRHFKPAAPVVRAPASAPAKMAPSAQPSAQPSAGFAQGAPSPSSTYTGSPFTMLEDMLSGTTHDIGAYQGRNYVDEIAEPFNPYDEFKVNTPW